MRIFSLEARFLFGNDSFLIQNWEPCIDRRFLSIKWRSLFRNKIFWNRNPEIKFLKLKSKFLSGKEVVEFEIEVYI